ncbi:MAG: acetyltransferase [Gammaproteobacteria bacterium]|nr:acetyltransferase [Gammaproteobacteria bacterium]
MLLKLTTSDHLVEVLEIEELLDPTQTAFTGRLNVGEEMPEADKFLKQQVCFPSGEPLPRCWRDLHYRDRELERDD